MFVRKRNSGTVNNLYMYYEESKLGYNLRSYHSLPAQHFVGLPRTKDGVWVGEVHEGNVYDI